MERHERRAFGEEPAGVNDGVGEQNGHLGGVGRRPARACPACAAGVKRVGKGPGRPSAAGTSAYRYTESMSLAWKTVPVIAGSLLACNPPPAPVARGPEATAPESAPAPPPSALPEGPV